MKSLRERYSRELGMLLLLMALVIYTTLRTIGNEEISDSLFNSRFLTFDNFRNVMRTFGIYGILSIGVGIVIITSGIDLSIGSMMAMLGVVFLFLLSGSWGSQVAWPLAVVFIMVLGLVLGVAHGFFVGKMKMQAFVVTLCGLLCYRGIARTVSDDSNVASVGVEGIGLLKKLGDGTIGSVCYGDGKATGFGSGVLYAIPMTLVYLAIVATVMGIVLHKSVYGRYLYATGRNEQAAKYSGINTTLVICGAYVICAGLTAFASIPYVMFTGSVTPSGHAVFVELYAIAGAVLGGCALKGGEGTIIGILIGTAILIVLQNMVNLLGARSSLTDVITGVVLFVGVLLNQIGIGWIKSAFGLSKKQGVQKSA